MAADNFPRGVALIVLREGAELFEQLPITEEMHERIARLLGIPPADYLRLLGDSRDIVIDEANKRLEPASLWDAPVRRPLPEETELLQLPAGNSAASLPRHPLQSDDPQVEALVWEYRHHSRRASWNAQSRIRAYSAALRLLGLVVGMPVTLPAAGPAPTFSEIQHLLDPTAKADGASPDDSALSPADEAGNEALQRIIQGIRKLRKWKHRELMLLVWDDGLPLAEAAKHMRIEYETARKRYAKACELLAHYRLVSRRDAELVCKHQERRETKAAVRVGANPGPRYKQALKAEPGQRGLGGGNFVTKPATPDYSWNHPRSCRCVVCEALVGGPVWKVAKPAYWPGSSIPLVPVALSLEDIACLKAAPKAPQHMHSCSRPAQPSPLPSEQQRYYARQLQEAIKRGAYGGEKKYTGAHDRKVEAGFGVDTELDTQNVEWSREGLLTFKEAAQLDKRE